jgi:hypothetical protein
VLKEESDNESSGKGEPSQGFVQDL